MIQNNHKRLYNSLTFQDSGSVSLKAKWQSYRMDSPNSGYLRSMQCNDDANSPQRKPGAQSIQREEINGQCGLSQSAPRLSSS
jgi:hypothetical protein